MIPNDEKRRIDALARAAHSVDVATRRIKDVPGVDLDVTLELAEIRIRLLKIAQGVTQRCEEVHDSATEPGL